MKLIRKPIEAPQPPKADPQLAIVDALAYVAETNRLALTDLTLANQSIAQALNEPKPTSFHIDNMARSKDGRIVSFDITIK